MILVVAATERELSFVEGFPTLRCGIGPVEAALATTEAIVNRRPRALLHIGTAGAEHLEPRSLVDAETPPRKGGGVSDRNDSE